MASTTHKTWATEQLLRRGPWSPETGSLSLDGFSPPGCPPTAARRLGPSGRGTHSLTDCGVRMGYTGREERPTGSRPRGETPRRWRDVRRVPAWARGPRPQGAAGRPHCGRRALVVTVGTAPATPRSATASGVKSFRNQSFRILLLPLLNPDAGPRGAGRHKARAGTPPLRRTGPPGCKGTPIPCPPEARAQHARDRGKNRSRIEALR